MQVRWGSYQFTANAVFVDATHKAVLNAAGIPYMYDVAVTCSGRVYGAGQAACSAAEDAVRAALRTSFLDFALLRDDGVPSSIFVRNADTIGGTHVTDVSFTGHNGAEFATFREFQFVLRFKVPIANAGTAFVNFTERMQYSGGGPVYAFKPAINGPPQKQLVWQFVPFRVVQAGEAQGFTGYPPFPPPFMPTMMPPVTTRTAPGRQGLRDYIHHTITWEYVMESAAPISAFPTLWKG